MPNCACHPPVAELCYLEASKVTSPGGVLSELDVLTPDGKRLGWIKGVIIDAAARCVRYFDVQPAGWFSGRRYLMEADQLAMFEPRTHSLRLRVEPSVVAVRDLDPSRLPRYAEVPAGPPRAA